MNCNCKCIFEDKYGQYLCSECNTIYGTMEYIDEHLEKVLKPKYESFSECSKAFEGNDGRIYCEQSYTTIQNGTEKWKQHDLCSDIDKSNKYVSCLMRER